MKNAAIYYVPEAFSITGQKLMGRNAAGWGFLKAFSKYADIDQLAIFIEKKESADDKKKAKKQKPAKGEKAPKEKEEKQTLVYRPKTAAATPGGPTEPSEPTPAESEQSQPVTE